jgi:hypothetical protein
MEDAYIFWRIWDGVPESVMPPFRLGYGISDADIWIVMTYTQQMVAANSAEATSTPTPGGSGA